MVQTCPVYGAVTLWHLLGVKQANGDTVVMKHPDMTDRNH